MAKKEFDGFDEFDAAREISVIFRKLNNIDSWLLTILPSC